METPNTNANANTQPETGAQVDQDVPPSQLILPDTDTGMRLWGYRADRLAYLLPGGSLVIIGAFAAAYGLTTLGSILVGVGVLLLAIGAYLIRTTPVHASGVDRMRGRLAMTLRSRSLPLDRAGAAGIHGVEQVMSDGSIEMTDGRVVRFARVYGRNTDLMTAEDSQTMINTLRKGIDGSKRLSEVDFSFYLMSSGEDAADITDKFKEIWLSERYDRERFRDVIGYLKSIIDGEPKESESWRATEWEGYLVVQIDPNDVAAADIPRVDGDAVRTQQKVEAESRLTALSEAFSSVPGVTARPINGAQHARVVSRHWAGTRHPGGFDGLTDDAVSVGDIDPDQIDSSQSDADERPPLDSSSTRRVAAALGGILNRSDSEPAPPAPQNNQRLKELLGASQWDVRPEDDMVVAGDQFCRTYYVGDWPVRPRALFLKELQTMRGIDMSVHHRFEARDTDNAKAEIQQATGSIDASVAERKEDANPLDAKVLENEMDAYVQLFMLLHHTDVQAWDVSSYVTVRAGDRTAIQKAEALIEQGRDEDELSIDLAKRKALEDACEDVEEALSGANLTPRTDATRQAELFRAAAPTGRNAYADKSSRARKRLCGTGAIAATFPPCATTVKDDMGVELGRNPTNGRIISIDPFKTPPAHRLTLGASGSGKTWATLKQAIRWYLSDPDGDRTLIFADNQGNFAGATGLLNGSTLTIGGHSTLNPLRMEPMSRESAEAGQLDPWRAKHRFVTELTLDLICETTDARERFRPLIRDGVDAAMRSAGLDPNDPSTHTPENSPTMADVRAAVEDIGADPSAHVKHTAETTEVENHVGALLRRLSGFAEDGEFSFLTGPSDAAIEPGEVTYLDLQQIEGLGATDTRTTMLAAALGEVHEAVKNAPGETLFIIDEAHHLLKSPRILNWLEERSRHWRHTQAGLWFISQHPGDFVIDEDADKQQHKAVIRDQAQVMDLFGMDDREALENFGLNSEQVEFLKEEASRGETDAANHTDCLVNHPDIQGWMEAAITVSAGEHSIFSYDPDEDGTYGSYIDRNWTRNKGLE